jgi:hypothetical protein
VTQADVAAAISTARSSVAAIASANATARYKAAAHSSLLAAPLIFASGLEVLPIGGFTGRIPSPTLAQLIADVQQGKLLTVLLAADSPGIDERIAWVKANCRLIPTATDSLVSVYYCATF